MRVIEPPPHIPDFEYKCVCGARLEATEKDVLRGKKRQWDQRDGGYDIDYYYVVCPLCSVKKEISPPNGWRVLHRNMSYSSGL